jgi:hypothetical protein
VSQLRPFFKQIDFHRQLADLALELSDLALVLGDVNRLGQLVGELARLVLADPKTNQIARETMPPRELMQPCATVEKFSAIWRLNSELKLRCRAMAYPPICSSPGPIRPRLPVQF